MPNSTSTTTHNTHSGMGFTPVIADPAVKAATGFTAEKGKELMVRAEESRKVAVAAATAGYETAKLEAAQAALAIPPRAKPRAAKPSTPRQAARPSTAPTAPTATRRDRRQAPLPLSSYSFGHLAAEAEAGSAEALTELQRRGFARTARNTFTRPA